MASRKRAKTASDGDAAASSPAWAPELPSYDEGAAFLRAALCGAGGSDAEDAMRALVRRARARLLSGASAASE